MDTLSPLTMKNAAKESGVSIATASHALKDNPSTDKGQREKIQVYAHEHNFYPNVTVESLHNSKMKSLRVISVTIPQLPHSYFSSTPFGIEEEASVHDYRIVVTQSNEKYDREVRICQDYFENKVRGVIVSQAKDAIHYEHLQKLINHSMPLVFYDHTCTGVEYSRVVVDDYMGIFNAAAHPIQTGCRRIAYRDTLTTVEISKGRYNGHHDAITKYGPKADDRFFRTCDNRADAKLVTPELLSQEEVLDAFLAVNDGTAVGILYAVKYMGYRVPEDIFICGFTNGDRAKAYDPMLTTVEQRGVRVGEKTVNILISRVEGFIPPDKVEKRVVRAKLIIGGATR